jgi:micrococcal nuclease
MCLKFQGVFADSLFYILPVLLNSTSPTPYIEKRRCFMRLISTIFIIMLSISAAAAEKAIVKRITDGDTLTVISGGQQLKVRLIGIDTPESKQNDKTLRDSARAGASVNAIIMQGKRATAFMKSLLKKGDTVSLEFDVAKYDRYGRILAYVYLSDGRFLNDLIISSGYASPLTVPPNVKYKDLFLKSYSSARENKKGLWLDEN